MHSKAQFDIFYNLLTAPHTVSNTYTQVAWAQLCANRVQHIERLSHGTCRFMYDGTAKLLSLIELKSHLFKLYFIGWTIKPYKQTASVGSFTQATGRDPAHQRRPLDEQGQQWLMVWKKANQSGGKASQGSKAHCGWTVGQTEKWKRNSEDVYASHGTQKEMTSLKPKSSYCCHTCIQNQAHSDFSSVSLSDFSIVTNKWCTFFTFCQMSSLSLISAATSSQN